MRRALASPPFARLNRSTAVVCGAVLAGGIVGVLMVHRVPLGFAAVAGLSYVALAVVNLPLAVVLWIPLAFIDRIPMGGAPSAAGLVILVSWIGALAGARSHQRALLRRHRNVIALLIATLAWITISMAWARYPQLSHAALLDWYTAGLLFLLLVTSVWSERLAWLAVWAIVAGAALAVATGLFVHPPAPPGTLTSAPGTEVRFGGASGDPNLLAAGLVGGLALAAALAFSAHRRFKPVLLLLVVPIAIGFAATASRGGLVAVFVAILAALLLARGRRRQLLAAVAVAVVCAGAWFAANPATFSRVTSFNVQGTGRATLWTVAGRMWTDHPLVGVGIGNFTALSRGYVQEPGLLTYISFITVEPKVVHNSYLQLLAETGAIGLLLYLATVAACLRAAWRAAKRFERLGRRDLADLSRGALVAGIGMLAALFFVTYPTDKRLWAVLALGPVLEAIAARSDAHRPDAVRRRRRPPDQRTPAASAERAMRASSHGRRRTSATLQGSHGRP